MLVNKTHSYLFSRRVSARFFCMVLVLIGSVAFLLPLSGCGGANNNPVMMVNQASASSLAFISNSGSGTVSVFNVSNAGALTPVPGSPFVAGAGAEFMAFDSAHNLLLVSNQTANSLSAFSVNTSTGTLTAVPGSPFLTGARPTGVAVAPMSGLVFVGNQNDSSVSVFSINSQTGSLTPVAGSPVSGIGNPFGLTVSPSERFLFVNNFRDDSTGGANAVSVFQINASGGGLASIASPFATSSPAGITSPVGLATDGKQLFVGNHMAESVVSLQIDPGSGALSSAAPLPPPGPSCNSSCHNNPLRLSVDPMDKFVFATNVQAGTVSTFSINSGTLSPVADAATGQHPFGVSSDPSGSFLYVVNKVDNTISGFSLNSNSGVLSPLPGSPFSGGSLNAPTDIVIVNRK